MVKTNEVRLLEGLGIKYELREYEVDPDDGQRSAFLASDESAYINAIELVVDGGATCPFRSSHFSQLTSKRIAMQSNPSFHNF